MHFNFWTFLFQIINFLVLAYLLHRLLYAPLRASIDQRRKKIADQLSEAEGARRDAETLKRNLDAKLADMQRQREEILQQAHVEAEEQRKAILAEANVAAQQHRQEFEKGLEHDRAVMLDSVQRDVVEQAVETTRRLLAGAADRTLHEQLLRHLLEALRKAAVEEVADIRRHWRPEEEVLLESAREPELSQLQEIASAASELAGSAVKPQLRILPELIEGARLRLGSHVWDASLSGQLPEGSATPKGVLRHDS